MNLSPAHYANTYQEARKRGDRYYYTGKECKRGHVSLRRASDTHCTTCRAERSSEYNSKENVKGYMRQWRSENSDKRRGYEKKWRDENPDSNRARSSNRRARAAGAEGFHTADDILFLRETQKDCQICKVEFSEENPSTLDHIIALANGGSNWPSNLQLLCRSCNSAKGAR